jgi:hypothetical protein
MHSVSAKGKNTTVMAIEMKVLNGIFSYERWNNRRIEKIAWLGTY